MPAVIERSYSNSSAPALPEVDGCGEGRVSAQPAEQWPREISKYLNHFGPPFLYLKMKMIIKSVYWFHRAAVTNSTHLAALNNKFILSQF